MVVNIQTKHDALCNFLITIMVRNQWNEILHSTWAQHMQEIDMWFWFQNYKFLWFRFQFWFHQGWFRFWFRFQSFPKNLIPIPIPIPPNQALIPILIPESDSDSGIIYNSVWKSYQKPSIGKSHGKDNITGICRDSRTSLGHIKGITNML